MNIPSPIEWRRTAESAGAGWGGDEMGVWRSEAGVSVGWSMVWDTVEDAEEASVAFARGALQQQRGGVVSKADAAAAITPGGLCVERPERGPLAIRREGERLVVAMGPMRRDGHGWRSGGSCEQVASWVVGTLQTGPHQPRRIIGHDPTSGRRHLGQ